MSAFVWFAVCYWFGVMVVYFDFWFGFDGLVMLTAVVGDMVGCLLLLAGAALCCCSGLR